MDIKYLTLLRDNPVRHGSPDLFKIRPIPEVEIEQLEGLYNDGKQFPIALRELLFLAGKYCYVLDYGPFESQQMLQDETRNSITKRGHAISRPFYVVDVFNMGDQFIFVYLDEGPNPPAYEAHYWFDPEWDEDPTWIRKITSSLSELINSGIGRVKMGMGAF